MFWSYVTSALRALRRDRFHAVLNISGLAVSLGAALLIALYVQHELSYEDFFTEPERVFRVESHMTTKGGADYMLSTTPRSAIDPMVLDFRGQMTVASFSSQEFSVAVGDSLSNEDVAFASKDFLNVLDFPVLYGDGAAALKTPGRVVLTREMALKLFGKADAVGERMTIDRHNDMEVGAVIADMPRNSDFDFKILVRAEAPFFQEAAWMKGLWTILQQQTFVRLGDGVDAAVVNGQMPDFIARHMPKNQSDFNKITFSLAPLRDMHLMGGLDAVPNSRGKVFMGALAGTGLLLVLIACFNYINLTTARSLLRIKEVGLRKILGGSARQLVFQFMGETLATTLVAVIAALALAAIFLPVFAGLVDRQLALSGLLDPGFLAIAAALYLIVSLLAGIYPALFLAHAQPTALFQTSKASAGGRSLMRAAMVLIQFSLTVGLIIAAGVVYSQVRYLKTIDLGFEKQGLLSVQGPADPKEEGRLDAFREQLALSPYFSAAALANSAPTPNYGLYNVMKRSSADDAPTQRLMFNFVGAGFMQVMGLPFAAGRDFSPDGTGDAVRSAADMGKPGTAGVILSESAVGLLGFSSPQDAIGQDILSARPDNQTALEIIGVVPDIKFNLAQSQSMPTGYLYTPGQMPVVVARQRSADNQAALADAQRIWSGVFPDAPFDYSYMEDFIVAVNVDSDRQSQLFAFFTGLAILVACLGLFGLASFAAARRTQEIAIRKVLGASTANVTRLLLWDFAKPVLLANIVAWPVAWLLMRQWLDGFAYRIDLSPAFFAGASAVALGIALLTVMARTMRAARIRPAMALKYE